MTEVTPTSPQDSFPQGQASDMQDVLLSPPTKAETGSKPGQPWLPPTPEELQKLLPQYEILGLLGRGGMGAVYQGRQIALDRLVAIKILSNDLEAADTSFAERFKNEARSMAKLSHPNIVAAHDSGQMPDGLLYIVMEFVEGTDVQKMIQASKRLHTEHAMAITAHVCDALAYAHARGIIHRDIKPANIMVGYDGTVKVADFGLAKMHSSGGETLGLTQSGMTMGTLHYMAPEALMLGSAVDQRADVYAVGVMLYHMLTGKLPHGMFELPSIQVPGLDPRYDSIIAKAMREDRELRYPTAAAMRAELDHIVTRPVVMADPEAVSAAELAAAALPTVVRPQRPGGQPYQPPPTRFKPQVIVRADRKGAPLLWVALIAMSAVAAWWFMGDFGRRNVPPPAASTPSSPMPAKPSAAPSSFAPAEATKERPFVNSLGMQFVPVPGTGILMCLHETRYRDYATYAAEMPGVDTSWKDQSSDGIRPTESQEDHPVMKINRDEAQAFCVWLSEKEGRSYRLPSDQEWSYAEGVGPDEKWSMESTPELRSEQVPNRYPWGSVWPPPQGAGNYSDQRRKETIPHAGPQKYLDGYNDGFVTTAPVMSFKPNPLGLYDMGGNVWEWVADGWSAVQQDGVQRGACYADSDRRVLSSYRSHHPPTVRFTVYGFRCVLDPAPRSVASATPAPKPVVPPPTAAATVTSMPSASAGASEIKSGPALPPELAALDQQFLKLQAEKVTAPFEAEVATLNVNYLGGIEREMAKEKAAGRLDGVLALEAEKQRVAEKQPMPAADAADVPAALKNLRVIYRAAHAKLVVQRVANLKALTDPLAVRLQTLEADLTKLDRIADAKTIRQYREGLGTADATQSAASPAASNPISKGAWRDLIADIDLKRDALAGPWDIRGRSLRCPKFDWPLCVIPVDYKGGNYDLKLTVTRGAGNPVGFFIAFRKAATGGTVVFDYFDANNGTRYNQMKLAGVERLSGKSVWDGNGSQVLREQWLPAGKKCAVLLQVRDEGLLIHLDGDEIVRWKGDWSQLSQRGGIHERNTTGQPIFGLGLFHCEAVVHSIEMLEVNGEEGRTLPPPPGAVAPRPASPLPASTQNRTSSPPAATATKATPFTNTLGMQFVPVPGTNTLFCVHVTRRQDYAAYAADPAVRSGVDGSWKNRERGGIPCGHEDDHPVVSVSWEDAQRFCAWLSQKESRTYRLPTDREWSIAMGIPPESQAQNNQDVFPWGSQWPPPNGAGNYADSACKAKLPAQDTIEGYTDGFASTSPVFSFSPNKFGLHDMGGNVYQWCEDSSGRANNERVCRGGSWINCLRHQLLSAERYHHPADKRQVNQGFRCVLEIAAP